MELTDEKRMEIANAKFSIIAPVTNGVLLGNEAREYLEKMSEKVVDMPHYGPRRYQMKTLKRWIGLYREVGIDALIPGYRSDKNVPRKISEQMEQDLIFEYINNDGISITLLYEQMVKGGKINPKSLSLPTVYRFFARDDSKEKIKSLRTAAGEEKEMRRYSHSRINELWIIDVLYGPMVKHGGRKVQSYLIAIIEDCSRLIINAGFYITQDYGSLRHCLKEGILRRGIGNVIYTDNGKIFRCQQFEFVCASLGSALIHSKPYIAYSRGKIERFFRTVRERFLSLESIKSINSVDELNAAFSVWLKEDYHFKPHKGLNGETPMGVFLSQSDNIKMVRDPEWLDEVMLIRMKRKVYHDATISLDKTLYETDEAFRGKKVEVRYDPDWLLTASQPVYLYIDGKRVGEAFKVDYQQNAQRNTRGKRSSHYQGEYPDVEAASNISFSSIAKGESGNV